MIPVCGGHTNKEERRIEHGSYGYNGQTRIKKKWQKDETKIRETEEYFEQKIAKEAKKKIKEM